MFANVGTVGGGFCQGQGFHYNGIGQNHPGAKDFFIWCERLWLRWRCLVVVKSITTKLQSRRLLFICSKSSNNDVDIKTSKSPFYTTPRFVYTGRRPPSVAGPTYTRGNEAEGPVSPSGPNFHCRHDIMLKVKELINLQRLLTFYSSGFKLTIYSNII